MVAGAERLREDVADARRFDHGAHAAARDDAGSGRSGSEQHAAATEFADDFMRDGVFVQRNVDHRLAGSFGGLADRFGHFVRLAETDTDPAVVVARDDERAEAEAAAALHDLGATVDEHDFFGRVTSRRWSFVRVAILRFAIVVVGCAMMLFKI